MKKLILEAFLMPIREDISPSKPKGVRKRKIIKNKGSNAAKEIIQYSFKTEKGNEVKVHFSPQWDDAYDVVFYVNDTLDDESSTKPGIERDRDILGNVIWVVKNAAEKLGAKEISFSAHSGSGDTKVIRGLDMEEPKQQLLSHIEKIVDTVKSYEPKLIPPTPERIALAQKFNREPPDLFDIRKEDLLKDISNIYDNVKQNGPTGIPYGDDGFGQYVYGDSKKGKQSNKEKFGLDVLEQLVDKYTEAFMSNTEVGHMKKRNRRKDIYKRLLDRYFTDWDVKQTAGDGFDLTKK